MTTEKCVCGNPETEETMHRTDGPCFVIPPVEEKFEYKIVAEAQDPLQSVIEKTGIKTRFTLLEIKQAKEKAERVRKELSGQVNIQNAKIVNYETNHPIVKDLSAEDVFAIHLFYEAKVMLEACTNKIKEVDVLFEEYAKEESEMARTIGISIPIEEIKAEKKPEPKE